MTAEEEKAELEALLFMATKPIKIKEIKAVTELGTREIRSYIEQLQEEYATPDKGIELAEFNDGYIFQTKAKYEAIIKEHHQPEQDNKLSNAALETLAIVAYKQPVTRSDIEAIRGVNVERVLTTLQKRALITDRGRKDAVGNPIIYGTTDKFLEYMGLESLEELPPPKEFNQAQLSDDELPDEEEDAEEQNNDD
ncbi:MAG: SMC-Scp complex subunit ScpB [Bacillota bacterium]